MPYKSKAQQKYLHAKKPKVAKEFDKETTNYKKLPEHVKPKKGKSHAKKNSK